MKKEASFLSKFLTPSSVHLSLCLSRLSRVCKKLLTPPAWSLIDPSVLGAILELGNSNPVSQRDEMDFEPLPEDAASKQCGEKTYGWIRSCPGRALPFLFVWLLDGLAGLAQRVCRNGMLMGSIEDACSCSKCSGGVWGVPYACGDRQDRTCFSTVGCGQRHTTITRTGSSKVELLSQHSAQATSNSTLLESLPRQSLGFSVHLDLEERLLSLWSLRSSDFFLLLLSSLSPGRSSGASRRAE